MQQARGAIGTVIEESWFGYTPNSDSRPDFSEAGVELKVTPYIHGRNGIRAKERLVCNIINYMSFPTFDFIKLSEETDWEESELYNYLAPTKFMFVIFRQRADNQYVFERVMFWNIPNEDLEQVRFVWEQTTQIIREGVELTPTPRGIRNNLPKKTKTQLPMYGLTALMPQINCLFPMAVDD